MCICQIVKCKNGQFAQFSASPLVSLPKNCKLGFIKLTHHRKTTVISSERSESQIRNFLEKPKETDLSTRASPLLKMTEENHTLSFRLSEANGEIRTSHRNGFFDSP